MTGIDLYYYVYYKLYKFSYFFNSNELMRRTQAMATFAILQFWIYLSLLNYYNVFYLKSYVEFKLISYKFIPAFVIILITEWLALAKQQRWYRYYHKFECLPTNENFLGSWMVVLIVVIIICNFAYSCHLYSPFIRI